MTHTFTIPLGLVRTVRIGLHTGLGDAAEGIEQVTIEPDREQYPEWYEEPLAKLDATRALLDVIGWGERADPIDVEIDLGRHESALRAALVAQVEVHEDMVEEAAVVDMSRVERGKAPKAQVTIARAGALDRLVARLDATLARSGGDERVEADAGVPPDASSGT